MLTRSNRKMSVYLRVAWVTACAGIDVQYSRQLGILGLALGSGAANIAIPR